MKNTKWMTRGELARKTGVGFETIRFYESKKLLPVPIRSEAGYRLYALEISERILFLKRAQELGFSLKEIKQLLEIADDPMQCDSVNAIAIHKIQEIQNKINDLEKLQVALSEISNRCQTNISRHHCPIIDALSGKR